MPAPDSPDPQSPEPRPLSEHEEQALRELEARSADEDPGLSVRLGRTRPPWHSGLSPRAYNAIIQVAVVFVVAVAVLPRPQAGALLAVAFMLIPALIAYWSIRRDSRR